MRYRTQIKQINENYTLNLEGANSVSFHNQGADTARIDGYPLAEDQRLDINGYPGYINVSEYRITFDGSDRNLYVILFYEIG